MSQESSTRRHFLQIVAHGSALAGTASLGFGCSSAGLHGTYAAGNVSQLKVGALIALMTGPVAVGRDQGGVYAMTLICTHQGCDMAVRGLVSSQGIVCSCHGSQFDVNGNAIQGPASSPLQHYEVTIDAKGEMTVNGDAPVSADTRAPVASG
jgi:nitrite reductase/ring-hydroxylating ferredoxin subunit